MKIEFYSKPLFNQRLPRAAACVADFARCNPLFTLCFMVFVAWAARISWQNPLGPGQDQHYHFMCASIVARWWRSDPTVRELYKFTNPLDANTLLYYMLLPLNLLLRPLTAWRIGIPAFYFVGYPAACAIALKILRRPLWGAMLAFPLAYVKGWSQGGFMPFTSAAPFFVLSIALMHRVYDRPSSSVGTLSFQSSELRVVVASIFVCAFMFLAHAHVYAWAMCMLAIITLVAMCRLFMIEVGVHGIRGAAAAIRVGILSLLVVAPSLALFAFWYWRTHHGVNSENGAVSWTAEEVPWPQRVQILLASFIHVRHPLEWAWAVALACGLMMIALLSGRSSRRELRTPELAAILSLASFIVLPPSVDGQWVGIRHIDFFQWCLPLVVCPALPRGRLSAGITIAAVVALCAARLTWLESNLRKLQREYDGINVLANSCPSGPARIAQVTFQSMSNYWEAKSLQQSHETFAAMCGLDTPVFDTTRYPYHVIPVRSRGKLPAPVTILENRPRWYEHAGLWKDFDYVLVHQLKSSQRDLDSLNALAVRVAVWNEWELWKSRAKVADR